MTRVAIVGGGTVGSATAHWLTRVGLRVQLFEAGVAGAEGASRHSGGMLRSIDPDPAVHRLSMLGTQLMHRWEALGLPGPSPVRRAPLYWLLDEALARQLQHSLSLHRTDDVRWHDAATVRSRVPGLAAIVAQQVLEDRSAAVADVRLAVQGLLRRAEADGAQVFEHCPVEPAGAGGRVAATGRHVDADVVVWAPGQALAGWPAGAGLTRRCVPQAQVTGLPQAMPCVIDAASGTYLRPGLGEQGFIGWSGEAFAGDAAPPPTLAQARARVQALAGALGWACVPELVGLVPGSDAYSADCRPLLRHSACNRQLWVGGLSGRGFKFGLLLGAWIAARIARAAGLRVAGDALPPEVQALDADPSMALLWRRNDA